MKNVERKLAKYVINYFFIYPSILMKNLEVFSVFASALKVALVHSELLDIQPQSELMAKDVAVTRLRFTVLAYSR